MPISSRETAYDIASTGPPVVLVHGLGLNRNMWQWQLPALTPDFKVVTYDLLGHGQSAKPAVDYSLTLFSDQLAGLIQDLDLGPSAIVGFSLGGMIARRFAMDHPNLASALVILNSAHDRTPDERAAILSRVEQVRANGPSSTVEAALGRWFTKGYGEQNPEVMDLIRSWVMANDPEIYPEVYQVLAQGDEEIATGLDTITCPVLVMTGRDDYGNSAEMAERMAAEIPGAEVEIIANLRHMGLAEAPEIFNARISSFLKSVLA